MWLGERVGLYRVLADSGPATAAELAKRMQISDRYERERVEQQAVAGLLEVDDTADPATRTFSIPPGHDEVLLDRDSLRYRRPSPLASWAWPKSTLMASVAHGKDRTPIELPIH